MSSKLVIFLLIFTINGEQLSNCYSNKDGRVSLTAPDEILDSRSTVAQTRLTRARFVIDSLFGQLDDILRKLACGWLLRELMQVPVLSARSYHQPPFLLDLNELLTDMAIK